MNLSIVKQIAMVRKKSLLFLAGGVVLGVVINLYTYTYQQPLLTKARSEWLQQSAAEQRGIAALSRDEVYKIGQGDLAKFRERIYPKTQFARFIGEIYETAANNRLDVSTISYKPIVSKESRLLGYSLTLAVVGNYTQLKKYINDLDSLGNLSHIDSISFGSQGGTNELVQLQVQMTAYFKKEAQ
jgi:Tfp pilus assembly protein PilO